MSSYDNKFFSLSSRRGTFEPLLAIIRAIDPLRRVSRARRSRKIETSGDARARFFLNSFYVSESVHADQGEFRAIVRRTRLKILWKIRNDILLVALENNRER